MPGTVGGKYKIENCKYSTTTGGYVYTEFKDKPVFRHVSLPQFGLEIVDNISFNIWDKEPYDNK